MHIKRETIRTRVLARVLVANTTVFGAHREANAASENFIQNVSIRKDNPVLSIDVVLGARDLLAQS